jgi:hypothetical protein
MALLKAILLPTELVNTKKYMVFKFIRGSHILSFFSVCDLNLSMFTLVFCIMCSLLGGYERFGENTKVCIHVWC